MSTAETGAAQRARLRPARARRAGAAHPGRPRHDRRPAGGHRAGTAIRTAALARTLGVIPISAARLMSLTASTCPGVCSAPTRASSRPRPRPLARRGDGRGAGPAVHRRRAGDRPGLRAGPAGRQPGVAGGSRRSASTRRRRPSPWPGCAAPRCSSAISSDRSRARAGGAPPCSSTATSASAATPPASCAGAARSPRAPARSSPRCSRRAPVGAGSPPGSSATATAASRFAWAVVGADAIADLARPAGLGVAALGPTPSGRWFARLGPRAVSVKLPAPVERFTTDPDAPLQQGVYRSALRDERLAAILGASLGILFSICFVTGLYSHIQQHPLSWLPIPARPAGLYRFTQGLHVVAGIASVPVLIAKLWLVWPRFVAFPVAKRAGATGRAHRPLPARRRRHLHDVLGRGQHRPVVPVAVLVHGVPLLDGVGDDGRDRRPRRRQVGHRPPGAVPPVPPAGAGRGRPRARHHGRGRRRVGCRGGACWRRWRRRRDCSR